MYKNLLAILALVAVLVVVPDAVHAQVKPFKIRGGGTAPLGVSILGDPSPHNATGNATHLGKYSGDEGIFTSLSFNPATGGTFKGSFVFVAANGDRLAFTYGDTGNGAATDGVYFPVPAGDGKFIIVFCAEFNPIPEQCTGRFADVIAGSFIMLAMTEPIDLVLVGGFSPPFAYTWEGEGTIEFAKGK